MLVRDALSWNDVQGLEPSRWQVGAVSEGAEMARKPLSKAGGQRIIAKTPRRIPSVANHEFLVPQVILKPSRFGLLIFCDKRGEEFHEIWH